MLCTPSFSYCLKFSLYLLFASNVLCCGREENSTEDLYSYTNVYSNQLFTGRYQRSAHESTHFAYSLMRVWQNLDLCYKLYDDIGVSLNSMLFSIMEAKLQVANSDTHIKKPFNYLEIRNYKITASIGAMVVFLLGLFNNKHSQYLPSKIIKHIELKKILENKQMVSSLKKLILLIFCGLFYFLDAKESAAMNNMTSPGPLELGNMYKDLSRYANSYLNEILNKLVAKEEEIKEMDSNPSLRIDFKDLVPDEYVKIVKHTSIVSNSKMLYFNWTNNLPVILFKQLALLGNPQYKITLKKVPELYTSSVVEAIANDLRSRVLVSEDELIIKGINYILDNRYAITTPLHLRLESKLASALSMLTYDLCIKRWADLCNIEEDVESLVEIKELKTVLTICNGLLSQIPQHQQKAAILPTYERVILPLLIKDSILTDLIGLRIDYLGESEKRLVILPLKN